jgi:hypothetical protein
MLLSRDVVALGGNSKTLKFLGCIQGHEVVILVGSGSSISFVNEKLGLALLGISSLVKLMKV